MVKKTIDIIKKNPIILIMYGIFFLVPILLSIVTKHLPLPEWLDKFFNMGNDVSRVKKIFSSSISLCPLLILMIFTQIPIRRYTGEILQGHNVDNWYIKSIKSFWWKDFVLIIIFVAAVFPIMFFMTFILVALGIVGIIIEALILITLITYITIGEDIVIVEDNFKTGLKNVFIIGTDYVVKYFAFFLILMAGGILFNYLDGLSIIAEIGVLKVAKDIISFTFNVLMFSFLSTYNIVNYLHYRDIAEEEIEEAKTPTDSSNYEKLDDSISEKIRDKFLYK